ncbi:Glycosyl transferase family 2 [Vibrio chagasii]|uniref:glycosyltransferase family 2 protein n=1 Tax=unclassified Vibrio TaxID=2614977 RepID=UPI0014939A40|nr:MULTISPECIES: glycosyltransferase family 2 protein [unclassified Vibrio]CAH6800102.1 Glycosyl transferase family 2 [Vibrio chagasii]NOI37746.1 glycosyltransferase family 2 protein [Vibrio sp. 070316B]NOI88658.1 glycosyltransferase family 2 protein [Vibrio sp. 99K-1]CAH6859638.1 Glycosyl transferase family 2 [Vibrio chagasii]CAH6868473.1 Glycosyl transferase family 2 [Vibrio chagasii]
MLVSIVILSYNRPQQVRRILENFVDVKSDEFCIIIKDDVSPLIGEIKDICSEFQDVLSVPLSLHQNEKNMGYDSNLMDSFYITNSQYVYLLSDDDFIVGNEFLDVISELKKSRKPFYISSYIESGEMKRVVDSNFNILELSTSQLIYNSILFSGLIFDREKVCSLKLDKVFLSSCIYTQVYLTVALNYEFSDYKYINSGALVLGGDGENYFGKNEAAKNKSALQDRASILSNLRYQVFLRKVILNLSSIYSEDILESFNKEYNRRLISYALRCKSNGGVAYKEFRYLLKELGIPYKLSTGLSLSVVSLLPQGFCDYFYKQGIRFLKKSG